MAITVTEKRDFLTWFIQHFRIHVPEVRILLEFLKGDDTLLASVHFVSDSTKCERALLISTDTEKQEPFLFFKQQLVTTDPQKAFHDIRMHPEQELYLDIDFPNAMLAPQYARVHEENPFKLEQKLSADEQQTVNHFVDEKLRQERIEQLEQAINEALDAGDAQKFTIYASALNELHGITLSE
ncbi:YpiB family protein [Brochothrix campestris]|uniref:Uncharacterized protein n=1 Tax=Brochothrix campestris FSL F6-1037 TaxID=1265861 RepID=W7D0S9_9LIST|nr:YpiB family protein [Brochothrix campestris]EUJ41601.1 hypothetical protein BCAMP_02935 [Brochothrix campestris FSL F6-1037]